MPVYNRNDSLWSLAVRYEGLPGVDDQYMDHIVRIETLTLPDRERRRKPKDLFANQTSRQVTVERTVCVKPKVQRIKVPGYPNGWQSSFSYDVLPTNLGSAPAPNFNPMMLKALTRIKDQKVNVSVLIPELGKTTDLFMNFSRSVYEGYKRLRRGEFIRGAIWDNRRYRDRQTKWLADEWLKLSYGWKPMMSDIWGLYQELNRPHIGNFKTIRLNESLKSQRNLSYSGFIDVIAEGTTDMRMSVRYREEGILRSFSAVGFTNPLATAWELIPYSFVLDWAIGVGDYLNTLDALVGIAECSVATSTKTLVRVSGKSKSTTLPTGGSHGMAYSDRETKTRNGVGPAWYPLPQLDGAFSWNRAANALALLRSLRF